MEGKEANEFLVVDAPLDQQQAVKNTSCCTSESCCQKQFAHQQEMLEGFLKQTEVRMEKAEARMEREKEREHQRSMELISIFVGAFGGSTKKTEDIANIIKKETEVSQKEKKTLHHQNHQRAPQEIEIGGLSLPVFLACTQQLGM